MKYYTERITENALYLIDEPENSLSAVFQQELAAFLADSARFFGCQLVIAHWNLKQKISRMHYNTIALVIMIVIL